MIVVRTNDLLFQAYPDRFIVRAHSGGIQGKKALLKYGTLNFVANFCRISGVVEETRNHYAETTRFCIFHHDPPGLSRGAIGSASRPNPEIQLPAKQWRQIHRRRRKWHDRNSLLGPQRGPNNRDKTRRESG